MSENQKGGGFLGKYILRIANKNDIGAIVNISHTSLGYPCEQELVAEKLNCLDSLREVVFVAEHKESKEVMGFIHLERYDVLYFETMCNILGLAVAEDAKRQGIGSLLIKEAEQWAAQHGIHFIRLNSGGTRADAHKFYRNLGFDNEKEQIRFIKTIDTGIVP